MMIGIFIVITIVVRETVRLLLCAKYNLLRGQIKNGPFPFSQLCRAQAFISQMKSAYSVGL